MTRVEAEFTRQQELRRANLDPAGGWAGAAVHHVGIHIAGFPSFFNLALFSPATRLSDDEHRKLDSKVQKNTTFVKKLVCMCGHLHSIFCASLRPPLSSEPTSLRPSARSSSTTS